MDPGILFFYKQTDLMIFKIARKWGCKILWCWNRGSKSLYKVTFSKFSRERDQNFWDIPFMKNTTQLCGLLFFFFLVLSSTLLSFLKNWAPPMVLILPNQNCLDLIWISFYMLSCLKTKQQQKVHFWSRDIPNLFSFTLYYSNLKGT